METRITTQTSIQSRAVGNEHLNCLTRLISAPCSLSSFHSLPVFHSLSLSHAPLLQGQTLSLNYFIFVSFFSPLFPTHGLSPWMAATSVVLIVCSFPSSGSLLLPQFIHPFVDVSLLSPSQEELGQGAATIPSLCAPFLYSTSPNFSLARRCTYTQRTGTL